MAKISTAGDFALDPQLEADTLALEGLELCALRLINDNRFPWLVMVPRIPEATEVHDLPGPVQQALITEISLVSEALKTMTQCDKINIAAFGNMVPQLHIHVIARFRTDPAWPGSAIGFAGAEPYETGAAEQLARDIAAALNHRS